MIVISLYQWEGSPGNGNLGTSTFLQNPDFLLTDASFPSFCFRTYNRLLLKLAVISARSIRIRVLYNTKLELSVTCISSLFAMSLVQAEISDCFLCLNVGLFLAELVPLRHTHLVMRSTCRMCAGFMSPCSKQKEMHNGQPGWIRCHCRRVLLFWLLSGKAKP